MLGGILYLNGKLYSASDTLQVLKILNKNLFGIMLTNNLTSVHSFQNLLNKPIISRTDVNLTTSHTNLNTQNIKQYTSNLTKHWKIPERGTIMKGHIADMVLFSKNSQAKSTVKIVFIKGHRVWQDGKWLNTSVKGECWFR